MSRSDGDRFSAEVADPRRHAVADFSPESETLLILFGGIAGGVSMPVFEFFRVTERYPVKRLFLRDPLRAWYLRGLPGVGDDALAVRDGLREAIRESAATRVVMAGASAGGFAALLFGAWLGSDAVVTFSPQSVLGDADRRALGDRRWPEQISLLHAVLGAEHPDYDLLPHLTSAPSLGSAEVHVSSDDALDLVHGRRIAAAQGVFLREHHDGGHRLVKTLRDSAALQPILLRALGVELDQPGSASLHRSNPPASDR